MAQFGKTVWFRELGEDGVSFGEDGRCQLTCESHDSRNLFLVIMIAQEQSCELPRLELCEAKVGRDNHWTMHGMLRTGMACVARRGKW